MNFSKKLNLNYILCRSRYIGEQQRKELLQRALELSIDSIADKLNYCQHPTDGQYVDLNETFTDIYELYTKFRTDAIETDRKLITSLMIRIYKLSVGAENEAPDESDAIVAKKAVKMCQTESAKCKKAKEANVVNKAQLPNDKTVQALSESIHIRSGSDAKSRRTPGRRMSVLDARLSAGVEKTIKKQKKKLPELLPISSKMLRNAIRVNQMMNPQKNN